MMQLLLINSCRTVAIIIGNISTVLVRVRVRFFLFLYYPEYYTRYNMEKFENGSFFFFRGYSGSAKSKKKQNQKKRAAVTRFVLKEFTFCRTTATRKMNGLLHRFIDNNTVMQLVVVGNIWYGLCIVYGIDSFFHFIYILSIYTRYSIRRSKMARPFF